MHDLHAMFVYSGTFIPEIPNINSKRVFDREFVAGGGAFEQSFENGIANNRTKRFSF